MLKVLSWIFLTVATLLMVSSVVSFVVNFREIESTTRVLAQVSVVCGAIAMVAIHVQRRDLPPRV